jgi:hypothetical protein
MTIHYKPWKGDNYSRGVAKGRRLLVLGESHYSDAGQDTIKYTKQYIDGHPGNFGFWTVIMQNVVGKKQWDIDRRAFWHSIALYNYIQEPIWEGPRTPPTPKMWAKAAKPFFEVLNQLKPTHLLVLGKRLWEKIPGDGRQAPPFIVDRMEREAWYYPLINGDSVRATWIYHPSHGKGKKTDENHRIISAFLKT